MPRHQRNLQITTSPNHVSLETKPEPPEDMWQRLEALLVHTYPTQRPEGGFTVAEYATRFQISNRTAFDRLNKLVTLGLIDKFGTTQGKIKAYYKIKDDASS